MGNGSRASRIRPPIPAVAGSRKFSHHRLTPIVRTAAVNSGQKTPPEVDNNWPPDKNCHCASVRVAWRVTPINQATTSSYDDGPGTRGAWHCHCSIEGV